MLSNTLSRLHGSLLMAGPARPSALFNEDDYDYAIELRPDDEYRYKTQNHDYPRALLSHWSINVVYVRIDKSPRRCRTWWTSTRSRLTRKTT